MEGPKAMLQNVEKPQQEVLFLNPNTTITPYRYQR